MDTEEHAHEAPHCCHGNQRQHMVSLVLTCQLSAGSCRMFDNTYFTERTHTYTHAHTHSVVRLCGLFLDPPADRRPSGRTHTDPQTVSGFLQKTSYSLVPFPHMKFNFVFCLHFSILQIISAVKGPLGSVTNSLQWCVSGILVIKKKKKKPSDISVVKKLHLVAASWLLVENEGLSPLKHLTPL